MSTLPKRRLTIGEYLEIEEAAEYKSEYYQGEMFAMSGVSWIHDLVAGNVGAVLRQKLQDRPCFVNTSDMRIHVPATTLFTYPDASVTCGEPKFLKKGRSTSTLLNPTLIIDVLSESTEGYDRGRKFEIGPLECDPV